MSLFRRKPKEKPYYGWEILYQKNELNGTERWVVSSLGFHSRYLSIPTQRHEFDTYEDARRFYADKVGWETVEVMRRDR